MKFINKALIFYIGIYTPLASAWKIGRITGILPTVAIPDPSPVPLEEIFTTPKGCTELSVGISRLNPGRKACEGQAAEGVVDLRRALRVFQGIQIRQGDTDLNPPSEIRFLDTIQEVNLAILRLCLVIRLILEEWGGGHGAKFNNWKMEQNGFHGYPRGLWHGEPRKTYVIEIDIGLM
ncbi:uncharacterized protein DFL_008623 [Arthrobotrys flagrans]|uniref:Uncharacterized protein n=1 Tax=Arthrobotrys flagrans TaxID=97331 RepID=A0A436ZPB4_ARTFL|nr:hypothetical protein DFL_008623 [Arthrobotrys flagrans]